MHTAATVEGEDRSVIDKMFIMENAQPSIPQTGHFPSSLVNALIATMGTTGMGGVFFIEHSNSLQVFPSSAEREQLKPPGPLSPGQSVLAEIRMS